MSDIFDLPEDHILHVAHRASIHHRTSIERSLRCGCFFRLAVFQPGQISDWIDDQQTALCPLCNIDSVIGDGSGLEISQSFLKDMRRHWFDKEDFRTGSGTA